MQSAICINESQTEVIKQRDHIWQNFFTLAKYFFLGKAICEGFLLFGKKLDLLCQILYAIGQVFVGVNG